MAIQKAFKPANKVFINGAAAYENEIAGFPHKVITWRGPLGWHKASCPIDRTPLSEKRDRFIKRSEVCYAIAETGEFEWSLAFCPDVSGSGPTATKRPLHCQLCGAQHNWCIFYRRANDQGFLGYSGCDCFHEVLTNIKHPAIDEVTKAAKEERARAEKFRKTMEKINDFKRDFPGLYEHREWLGSAANPYDRLWHEVENQLNRAEGVDEEFLAECAEGKYDRSSRRQYRDNAARRLPGFLKWAAHTAGKTPDLKVLEAKLLDHAVTDENEHYNAKRICEHREGRRPGWSRGRVTLPQPSWMRPQPTPAPVTTNVAQTPAPVQQQAAAPTAPKSLDQIKGEYLDAAGEGWSAVVKRAVSGKPLSPGQSKWIHDKYQETVLAKQAAKPKDDTPREPTEGKAPVQEPESPNIELTIQVGDGG